MEECLNNWYEVKLFLIHCFIKEITQNPFFFLHLLKYNYQHLLETFSQQSEEIRCQSTKFH